jgi:phage-related protein
MIINTIEKTINNVGEVIRSVFMRFYKCATTLCGFEIVGNHVNDKFSA